MRLVLVHGINNENNSPQEVENTWMGALQDAWSKNGLANPRGLKKVIVAYYATALAEFAKPVQGAVTAGTGIVTSTTELALLQEYAQSIGITSEDVIAAAQEMGVDINAVEAGLPYEGWFIALGGALERALPSKGKYLVRIFLRQAAVYIERKGVQNQIKNIIRPLLFGDERQAVVVAHSLGTVISYELLTEDQSATCGVPLFCTLGSPLAVAIVANYVGKRHQFPKPPIQRWVNGLHRNDFVTLGRRLNSLNIGFEGIENDEMIVNDGEDKHDIRAYLSSPSIAAAIHSALDGPSS
jgi:hypothetical protein